MGVHFKKSQMTDGLRIIKTVIEAGASIRVSIAVIST